MLVAIIVLGTAVALLLLYGVVTFNGLVRMRNECEQAFSDIDVQLRRRHDLIPNLVETVKGYAGHERQVLEDVAEARGAAVSASGPDARARAEGMLEGALRRLFAVAENYPDLKADRNFRKLQAELTDSEDRIQNARRNYNASVRDMNIRVASFPSRMVARMAGMGAMDFFGLEAPAEREAPSVSFAP